MEDLRGRVFGFLRVIKFSRYKKSFQQWYCKCVCGNIKEIDKSNLLRGTYSCGCKKKELISKKKIVHGKTLTKIYATWRSMKSRCLNPNNPSYKRYGGRGITICKKWIDFEKFYADMGDPKKGESLERINNDKGYYKSNCRWATAKEQSLNRSSNHYITLDSKTKTITDWANLLGVSRFTILGRLRGGWDKRTALTSPPNSSLRYSNRI